MKHQRSAAQAVGIRIRRLVGVVTLDSSVAGSGRRVGHRDRGGLFRYRHRSGLFRRGEFHFRAFRRGEFRLRHGDLLRGGVGRGSLRVRPLHLAGLRRRWLVRRLVAGRAHVAVQVISAAAQRRGSEKRGGEDEVNGRMSVGHGCRIRGAKAGTQCQGWHWGAVRSGGRQCAMAGSDIAYLGSSPPGLPALVRCRSIRAVVKGASLGRIGALLLDARTPDDSFTAEELLRASYDDPHGAQRPLHPHRVLALVPSGDIETAFALGRYGIAGVMAEPPLEQLAARLNRILRSEPEGQPLVMPALSPARAARLVPRGANDLPTVTIGYRHAPETLELLGRYTRVLREHAHESSVFADTARLFEVLVAQGLTCQTNLACKVGATHSGQFTGAPSYYRSLRHTRYRHLPDPPGAGADLNMEGFITIDEILHDVLHLLFLANHLRAKLPPRSTQFAEELSVSWWQGVIHNRVFPEWLNGSHILEINDDFLLQEQNQSERDFWTVAHVFDRYQHFPWVRHVLYELPLRASYIGERPDLPELLRGFEQRPEAQFLLQGAAERLGIPVPFDQYPVTPLGM